MAVYTEIELRCDGGPGPYDCEPPIYAANVQQARDDAKRKGWLTNQGGKDYCPEHRDAAEGVPR